MWGKLKWRWWAAMTIITVNNWIDWAQAKLTALAARLIMGKSKKEGEKDDNERRPGD